MLAYPQTDVHSTPSASEPVIRLGVYVPEDWKEKSLAGSLGATKLVTEQSEFTVTVSVYVSPKY
jgi:hypothetical protein